MITFQRLLGGWEEFLISPESSWLPMNVLIYGPKNPETSRNRARNTFQKASLSTIPVLLAGTDLNWSLPGKGYSNLLQKCHWWRFHQFSTGIWLPTVYVRKLLKTFNLNFTRYNHPPPLLLVPPPTDTKEVWALSFVLSHIFSLLFCRPNKTFFFQSFLKLHFQAFW